MSESPALRIRWATWWPVPYWTERFNALAVVDDVDLEVIFLSCSSELLPVASVQDGWSFKFRFLRDEAATSGYADVRRRIPKPWSLVRGRFDLLIMPYGDPDYVAAAVLCIVLRKKYSLFMPNNKFDNRKRSRFREALKGFICRHAIGVLTTGTSQREYVLDYRAGSDDVHIVGNPAPKLSGLNNLRTDAARTVVRHKFGWDGKFVVLYVGRFSIEKGLETLIRSVEYLSIRDVPVRAVFVGSGPDETRLRGLAATRGVSVEFVGFLEGEELTKRYVGADVFVLPSTSEPWGLVVNEAMEAGLPVVVSDHVGARYALVHEGENGAVFPVSDSQALTRILVELASDRRRRTTMSEASRKIITDHSVESWVHRVVDAIRQISLRSPRY